MPTSSEFAARLFDPDDCLIVAEVGQAHEGSLGNALAYIDAAAAAGAHAIKFQTHIAAAESTPREPWRVKFSPQDETRFDYWKRMEFTPAQWELLAARAAEKGIFFLSSAFSFEAVSLLEKLQMPAWKVGAGETVNLPLIRRMASTGKPVLLSSGMSAWAEMDAAVECARGYGAPVAVFQCTTKYPCPAGETGLNVIAQLRARYGCPAGLSDHSGTTHAGIAAAALGASMVEVHITFSRACFGPDVPASLTIEELATLVQGVRFVKTALAHPVDKDAMAAGMDHLKQTFGRSIVAARPLPAGTRLTAADIALRKPGGGLTPALFDSLPGRLLRRDLQTNDLLTEEDLE